MEVKVNFTAKVMLILMLFTLCVFAAVEGHRQASEARLELRLQKEMFCLQDTVLKALCQRDTTTVIRVPHQCLVTVTKYNAVPEQTDATPFNTADGSFIDTALLRIGHIRWVAVSRDLLKKNGGNYEYGDTVYLYTSNPAISGGWVVHDCMHRKHNNRVDILQPLGVNDISGHTKSVLSEVTIKPCQR